MKYQVKAFMKHVRHFGLLDALWFLFFPTTVSAQLIAVYYQIEDDWNKWTAEMRRTCPRDWEANGYGDDSK